MDERDYWNHYVNENGGPTGVAEKLGIPYPSIAAICNGQRGIGHALAKRMANADPILDAKKLVWVRPEKREPARREPAAGNGDAAEADGTPVSSLKDAA